jgi:hypothetical protein
LHSLCEFRLWCIPNAPSRDDMRSTGKPTDVCRLRQTLDLVAALADSVANALGTQLQVVSLVLLAKTLDKLLSFPEPVAVAGHLDAVYRMAGQACSGLLLVAILIGYYRIQRHEPIFLDLRQLANFIGIKKLVALVLRRLRRDRCRGRCRHPDAHGQRRQPVAALLRTLLIILIFADIQVALASVASGRGYRVVFANSALRS